MIIGIISLFIGTSSGASVICNLDQKEVILNNETDATRYIYLNFEVDNRSLDCGTTLQNTKTLDDINYYPPYTWEFEYGKVTGLGGTYDVNVDKSIGRILARTQATGAGMYLSGSATAIGALGVMFQPSEGNVILSSIYFEGFWSFCYWCNDNGFFQEVYIRYTVEEGDELLHDGIFYHFTRSDPGVDTYEKNFNYKDTPNVELTKGHKYEIWFAIHLYSAAYGTSQHGSAILIMNYYPDVYLDLDLIKIKVDRENQPPNTPSRPSGPTSGNINTFYTYTTSATDPNNDELYYQWYWGDEYSSWFGPYPSGQQVSARHSWNERGTYNIKVRVKDEYGEKSHGHHHCLFRCLEVKQRLIIRSYI